MPGKKKFETDAWPYVAAKWQKKTSGTRKVRLIEIHAMESQEKGDTAESVGHYFQTTGTPGSSHIGVDSNSIVQYVHDNDVAYGSPGTNHDAIHVELAGMSDQTQQQWLDPYGVLMLERAADAVAQYCLKYDIPVKHLSIQELKQGKRGIIGHWDATIAYPPNNGHTDPGPNFPWNFFFLDRVRFHVDRLKGA